MHGTYLLSLQKSCFQQELRYSGYVQRTSDLSWSEKTTVNRLFFVNEKFSSLRPLTKIFYPKNFLILKFLFTEEQKTKY